MLKRQSKQCLPRAKPTGKNAGKRSARAKSTGKAGLTAGGKGAARSTSQATPTDESEHDAAALGAGKFGSTGPTCPPKARNAFQLFYAHCLVREKKSGRNTNSKKVSKE